jgi:glycerol-3-phosphate acyltransferase PlsX
VGMSEHPREAIRKRKDSSMRIAIDLVKEGRAGAMVSAGNTGALTAISHFVLKTVGPVERAPIMSAVPARNGGHTHMLDLGANTKASAIQLAQFATMGSIVARDVFGVANPRVGLLNIGEEDTKGHEIVQEAHELIRASGVNYLGFVEGNNIFDESVDVVVTDGFTGNIALKTAEGTAKQIGEYFRAAMRRSLLAKLGAVLAQGAFRALKEKMDPRQLNGGIFLGLNGIVVKSHGGTDATGFASAVDTAYDMASSGVVKRIAADIARFHAELELDGAA